MSWRKLLTLQTSILMRPRLWSREPCSSFFMVVLSTEIYLVMLVMKLGSLCNTTLRQKRSLKWNAPATTTKLNSDALSFRQEASATEQRVIRLEAVRIIRCPSDL